MRSVGTFFFLLFLTIACDTERSFSVPEENYFIKFYGEEGEQTGVDFVVNPDGTIVMVGNTERPGVLSQIYVVKVDPNGHELWNRKFGLPDKNDWVKDVELHPDGRIVIAGETEMGVGNKDVYLLTISQDGDNLDSVRVALKKSLNETNEEVKSVSIISNGFIVAGASTALSSGAPGIRDIRDAMHLRFDNSLNWISQASGLWQDVTGSSNGDDIAVKVFEIIPDSVYYVFGSTNADYQLANDAAFDYDYWIFQLGSTGNPAGVNPAFGGVEDDILTSVEISPEQSGAGFVLSGISTKPSGFSESFLVKINKSNSLISTGKITDKKPTEIGNNASGIVRTVGQFNETFLLISNDYNAPNLGSNISLLKLSRDFSVSGKSPLIFGGEGDDFAGSVAELPNGRILLMGTMTVGQSSSSGQKKMVLMKLNSEGKLAE